MKKTLLLIAALLIGFCSMAQETYKPTAENLKACEQFQDEKFGIFLHWGLYSMIGAGEWVMTNWNINHREYPKLAKTFYPSEFDADAWVSAIKAAGAKYITITTRHHDGFSLFKTATSTYNTVDGTPFKRDIIKELADGTASSCTCITRTWTGDGRTIRRDVQDWEQAGTRRKPIGTATIIS